MKITQEWIDEICDENGLTNGQSRLLAIWCRGPGPYIGWTIPDYVARFIEKCKGYRGVPTELREALELKRNKSAMA